MMKLQIAATLTSGTHGAGVSAPGRRKEDDVNLIAHAVSHAKSGMRFDPNGEDYTEPGEHLLIPFDTTQITSKGNYSEPKAGDPCHPLAAGAHAPAIAHTLQAEGADASEDGTGRGVPMIATVAPVLRGFGHGWRGQHNDDASKMGMVRRLTPTECERLQGFPDGWTCLCGVEPYSTMTCRCPDSARYRAMGNAVTVQVIEWIGRRLLAACRSGATQP